MITWQPGLTLEQMEREVIQKAYRFFGGNKTATANSLGIAIRTLDSKLEKYNEEQNAKDVKKLEKNSSSGKTENGSESGAESQSAGGVLRGQTSSPAEGVRMESASQPPKEQTMPVQERGKVQGVLPKKSTDHGNRRSR